MERLTVSDVTLKEVSKTSEFSLSFREKIEISKLLDKVNVNVIELPAIKKEKTDVLLIKSIASCVKNSVIAVPVSLAEEDVERVAEALKNASKPRIQIVVPTSTVQMEFVCGKKPPMVLEMIDRLVKKAKEHTCDVEFVAEDATRSEPEFLSKAISTAISSGASTITLSDAAGTMLPDEISVFIDDVKASVPESENVNFGIQCIDTLGMACACSVTAVKSGVNEIKTSVLSSADAAYLDSICKVIGIHGDELGCICDVKTTELGRVSKQIEWIISSKNEKGTGLSSVADFYADDFILNEHDDITEVTKAVKMLGYDLSQEDISKVYEEFKRISGKKNVGAKELDAIVASAALQVPATYVIDSYVINSGNVITATANITLNKNGEKVNGLSIGDGPIDAAFLAIEQIVGHHYELDDFQIQSVTEGREAMGSALVKLRSNGRLYSGKGISTDIIGASIRAYLNALNKIVYEEA
ncbi:MAG: hypothetical protein IJB74_01000 [Clostridia bacterium]|nr:hypothetical protein [Clostridia bacterium]